jgi:hypothetical protein
MTVKQVKDFLNLFPDEAHVVVAIIPAEQLIVPAKGTRFEITNIAEDKHGCMNIVASTSASQPDSDMVTST